MRVWPWGRCGTCSFVDEFNFSLRTRDEDELSITASEGMLVPSEPDDLIGLVGSGVVAQTEANILARAAASIRPERNPQPSPKHSQLDYWFLGTEPNSHPLSLPWSMGQPGGTPEVSQIKHAILGGGGNPS